VTVLAPIRDKMERALRNSERLHLDVDQVRALARTPVWALLAELTAKEIAALWENEQHEPAPPPAMTTPPVSSSAPSGSTIAPNAISGSSRGTTTEDTDELVERAERRRALAAVSDQTDNPRRKRKTP
jgi:hypothetical protein